MASDSCSHHDPGSNDWALKIKPIWRSWTSLGSYTIQVPYVSKACFSAELIQLFSKQYYVHHVLAQWIELCSGEQARQSLVPCRRLPF